MLLFFNFDSILNNVMYNVIVWEEYFINRIGLVVVVNSNSIIYYLFV